MTTTESIGYITCWSNPLLGNKYKIVISAEKPIIIEDDNDYRVTDEGVFSKFELVSCKEVINPNSKLRKLYDILEAYRCEAGSMFFECELSIIYDAIIRIPEGPENKAPHNRILSTAFTHGQAIRHRVMDHYRYGVFDKTKNKIISNGNDYTINQFTSTHYAHEMSEKRKSVSNNAWFECECLTNDGTWISTYSLPIIRQ